MANLRDVVKRAKHSKRGKRFLNSRDMSEIKHQEAVYNSRLKRGEIEKKGENHYISICGCGVEGCTIHSNYANVSKEDWEFFNKRNAERNKPGKSRKTLYSVTFKTKKGGSGVMTSRRFKDIEKKINNCFRDRLEATAYENGKIVIGRVWKDDSQRPMWNFFLSKE